MPAGGKASVYGWRRPKQAAQAGPAGARCCGRSRQAPHSQSCLQHITMLVLQLNCGEPPGVLAFQVPAAAGSTRMQVMRRRCPGRAFNLITEGGRCSGRRRRAETITPMLEPLAGLEAGPSLQQVRELLTAPPIGAGRSAAPAAAASHRRRCLPGPKRPLSRLPRRPLAAVLHCARGRAAGRVHDRSGQLPRDD